MYTQKFNKDTKTIKLTKNISSNNSKETNLNEDLPFFAFGFFLEKFKIRKIAEQVSDLNSFLIKNFIKECN